MAALIKIDHAFNAAAAGGAKAVRFCSRCGEPAEEPAREEQPLAHTRVCRLCGMGMLLTCLREALPGARAAFMVVTAELRVGAVSEAAELLFGSEQQLLGQPVLDVVTSPMGDEHLGRTLGQAAMRPREPVVLPIRGRDETRSVAGMLAARVSTCGPPRAALLTAEPSDFGRH